MSTEMPARPVMPSLTLSQESSCFACAPDNLRGLRLNFSQNEHGESVADWIPDQSLEGFAGIVHGGIVSTVLDESMAKAVIAAGLNALTAELRVRMRQHLAPSQPVRVRGWIADRNRRMIHTEATLEDASGAELAHAWAVFLIVK